jgi:hypothetical protein
MAADGPGGGWLEGRQVRVHRPAGIPSHLVLVAWAVTQLDVCVPSWVREWKTAREAGLCLRGGCSSQCYAVVICRQTVGRQHGRSIAESIFLAFPFLLLHTLPSLMHVCSLSGSPCSDFLLHVLPRLSHVR